MTDTQDIDVSKLDPNDPEVYANPERLRMLPPTLQMIGIINLAQSGQMVAGNEVMTLEAILAGAGYQIDIDGHFSTEELAALQNFEDKLNDKQFKEAGEELLKMVLGTTTEDKPAFPLFRGLGAMLGFGSPAPEPDNAPDVAQTAAAKVLMKLMPGA